MAFKISENSLFAVLLRSPWWYSVLAGLLIIAITMVLFGGRYVVLGLFGAIPFFGIAAVAGFKQSKLPIKKRIQEIDEQARAMPAPDIAKKIADSYEQRRFDVEKLDKKGAELLLIRGNQTIGLSSKRFKVANTGIEPLKQLVEIGNKREATGYLYVALGSLSAAAADYAKQNDIEIIQASKLAAYFDGQVQID